ncbi:hypothetical protein PENTCL1PPCAC_8295, partial [Pristionchus entomophagus]
MGISPDSSLGGAAVCRICHCGETSIPYLGSTGGEPLISPCHCKGTMGLYHRSCVEHWLTLSGTACCEICNFRFELQRKNRTFYEFVKQRGCFVEEGRGTMTDVMCFTVLTPFAVGSSYLCMAAALTCYDDDGEWNAPEGIAMLTMAGFLIMIYLMWLAVTVAFYRSEYRSWRKKNQVIFVVDQLSPDESLHFNGNRTSFPMQWIRKMTSFLGLLTRWRQRGSRSADVSAVYIPEAMMNGDAERGENSGPFVVSPMDSFYAAGQNVEYPANVYSESSEPLLGAGDESMMMMLLAVPAGTRTSISPIAVCSPRPPAPERHPSPPSLVSSFSCLPASESGGANMAAADSARCPPRTGTLPRRSTITPICVTAASGSLQPLQQSTSREARTPLSATLSTISSISTGFYHGGSGQLQLQLSAAAGAAPA